MAIDTDFSVAANGDIRYVGDAHGGAAPGNYTVIEFHRWLQDLADNATHRRRPARHHGHDPVGALDRQHHHAAGAVQHRRHGRPASLRRVDHPSRRGRAILRSRGGGRCHTDTQLQIVQNNAILTSYWGTGLNTDATANILLRIMVKTRAAAADIDGKRIRVFARELGDTYSEFSVHARPGQRNGSHLHRLRPEQPDGRGRRSPAGRTSPTSASATTASTSPATWSTSSTTRSGTRLPGRSTSSTSARSGSRCAAAPRRSTGSTAPCSAASPTSSRTPVRPAARSCRAAW